MKRLAHCAVAVALFVVLLLAGLAPATATAQRGGHYTLLIENDSRYDIYYLYRRVSGHEGDYHPTLLVIQRELLATAHGAGLVGRIRTDPAL